MTSSPNQVLTAPASESHTHHHRRHRKHNPIRRFFRRINRLVRWQVILISLLIIVVVPSAIVVSLAADSSARVRDSLAAVKRVMTQLSGRSLSQFSMDDMNRLQFSIDDLNRNLQDARQKIALLRPLASAQPDIRGTLNAMDVAYDISQAAQNILSGLQPSLFFMINNGKENGPVSQLSFGERLNELLQIGRGQFVNASRQLQSAGDKIKSLDLSGISSDTLLTAQELIRYQAQLQDLNSLLLTAPDLITKAFGLDSPQDYLVLSANSDELRPSGGYISTWGSLRVRRVHISDYTYSATTRTSPNPPPDSMVTQLPIPNWWLKYDSPIYAAWDGSWYADFPATAQMAAWYSNHGGNPHAPIGGVIGIDLYGFESILQGLGSVTVPDYNERVTADNFRQVIYDIRVNQTSEAEHKKFLAALYRQIMREWQNVSADRSEALFNGVVRALQEKHIMVYFQDQNLNKAMQWLGWTGAQIPARDVDYLMVADTNMGSKSNRSIDRQLTYDVAIQPDGSLRSRATIAYDFSAEVAAKDPAVNPRNYNDINYWNLMQVFVPVGSTLTDTRDVQDKVNTAVDGDHTDFVTQTEVKFDSTERFQLQYTVPPRIESYGPYKRYRLVLQKQPGMYGETVNVQVSLPAGSTVVSASPDPSASYSLGQPVLAFITRLTTDQTIEIVYK